MASQQPPFLQMRNGPYKGDISALCLLAAPWNHRYPFLLAGTGPQILLFDMGSFELLLSERIFEGIRMHGIEVWSYSMGLWVPCKESGVFTTIAVHGERIVKLYKIIVEEGFFLGQRGEKQIKLNVSHTLPRFKHWILDVRFLKVKWEVFTYLLLVLVTILSICGILIAVPLYTTLNVQRDVFCIPCGCGVMTQQLFSLQRVPSSMRFLCGTWAYNSRAIHMVMEYFSLKGFDNTVSPKRRLRGHEGSIFRIAWSQDGKQLASVSDDRSMRVWNIEREPCESLLPSEPSGNACMEKDGLHFASAFYGHTARIWDCHIDPKFLITASEDCTYRIWTVDGQLLVKTTAHVGRGIWRCVYDSNNATLITAGADSSIKVHSLFKWLSELDVIEEDKSSQAGPTSILEAFSISLEEADVCCKKIQQLDSKSEYVRCLSLVEATWLYVATNQGYLKCVCFTMEGHETWTEIYGSPNCEPILCLDTLRLGKKCQDDDCPDKVEDWIVMGDGKGFVTVLCGSWSCGLFQKNYLCKWPAEGERKLLGVYWSRSLGPSCVFTADPCGALCMWSLRHSNNQLLGTLQDNCLPDKFSHFPVFGEDALEMQSSPVIRYQSCFNARIVCLDVHPEEELLICGDQRGNIIAFLLPSCLASDGASASSKFLPLASFKGAHGISTVASLCVTGKRNQQQVKICSTGRDGCICTFALDKSSGMLVCLRVEKVPAVTVVESCAIYSGLFRGACKRMIVGGFTAVDFLICDLQSNCEIVRVSCGGWRRPHSYLIGDFPEVQYCFVFVKDGMIHVYRKWFLAPIAPSPASMLSVANSSSFLSSLLLQSQFHGREVHSVNLISRTGDCNSKDGIHSISWVATGAEDGTVRIMRFNEDTLEQFDVSQVLGEHVGGSAVRAVTSITGYSLCNKHCPPMEDGPVSEEPAFILISVGAKEVMTCWLLEWEDDFDRRGKPTQMLSSRWLNTKRCLKKRKPSKSSQKHANAVVQENRVEGSDNAPVFQAVGEDDHRYLAVTAFSIFCPQTRLHTCFAVTASSNATVSLHAFQLSTGNWADIALLDYHKAPVLTLQHLVIPDCNLSGGYLSDMYMVFSGATDGSIALWNVTDIVSEFCHKQLGKGYEKVHRPPSGRGSQGGRRWKLSKRQKGDQVKSFNEELGEEASLMDSNETLEDFFSHISLGCDSDVGLASYWGLDHAKEGFTDPYTLSPEFLLPSAHQSGVNSLFASTVKEENHTQQMGHMWIVVSGGDDQALHVATFTVNKSYNSSANTKSKVVCLIKESILSAHSSAIKGVWTDGSLVFSTGLDQRLRSWCLELSRQHCSLVECCQSVINVPEPAALHVEHFSRRNYRIAVVGRGLQIFEVRGA